ncbi:MAG TPA: T9SS type A sorting domain-containing protein, partial [bacterium]
SPYYYWDSWDPVKVKWSFDLVPEAVITGCWMKPPNSTTLIEAGVENLTDAEAHYALYPSSKPKLLLRQRTGRNWYGSSYSNYEMVIEPVEPGKEPLIRISVLAPAAAYYQARRFQLFIADFYVYDPCGLNLSFSDADNPQSPPNILEGYGKSVEWHHQTGWSTWLQYNQYQNLYYNDLLLRCGPESQDRSLLRVWEESGDRFYQLALTPPILPDDRRSKTVCLAVDIAADNVRRKEIAEAYEQAVRISMTARDSVALVYSSFTPRLADSLFLPASAERLDALFKRVDDEPPPSLSTLPHLLRKAVDLFNRTGRSGEIWLVSDATTHSSPAAAAMDIIRQTFGQAVRPVVFRIIGAASSYANYVQVGGQYYYGNDYLYENLARLSRGSQVALRNVATYTYLDVMLDCVAPTLGAAEFDPEPASGISYSRYPLDRGRSDFPVTLPHYEIGLYDGFSPWTVHCFGALDGTVFSKDVALVVPQDNSTGAAIRNYWYARYVGDLLLEPQSHRTIAYIESVSVANRLLTPYTGFIIPGPDGQLAFTKLESQSETAVESAGSAVPENASLGVFPNPFNAEASIRIQLTKSHETPAQIDILNLLGQRIRTWSVETGPSTDRIEVRWNGCDENGRAAPSGIYIVVLRAGLTRSVKILLQR